MIVDNFLSKLDKVKRTGTGSWIAACPAHDDKHPSMTITEGEDGKVLCKCFSGCSIEEITGAVGMQLSDLFPPKMIDPHCKPSRIPFNPRDVLSAVSLEMTIVVICASDMAKGKTLSPESKQRLLLAAERITTAVGAVNA